MRLYPFKISDVHSNRYNHYWFAWYPVKTTYGEWVVFERVERYGYVRNGKWIYGYYRMEEI